MLVLNRNAIALFAIFSSFTRLSAAGTRPDDYVSRAKQLIRTLYPSLDGSLHAVIIDGQRLAESDTMSNFSIELVDIDPKGDVSTNMGPTTCWCSKPELSGKFIFKWQTPNKELIFMTVGGPAVTGRRDKFAAEVNKHPEWSDARVLDALNAAGAKFGPDHKAELLQVLPLDELREIVGGGITAVSADLRVRWFGTNPPDASLTWLVKARWHGVNGQDEECTLAVEPFEGKLESFERMFHATRR